jgi:serine/threonine-protein kinase RsbW
MRPVEHHWTWTKEGSIASDLNAAHSVISEVMERVRQDQWSSKDTFAVELTLEEAFVNAITHGNESDMAKQVHFVCKASPEKVWFYVEDEGRGFDPDLVANPTLVDNVGIPSGRGIYLIRGFATSVQWNGKGNAVTIEIERNHNTSGE